MDDELPRLTYAQRACLCYIADYMDEHGNPPLLREIAGHFGNSRQAAHQMVKTLREIGVLRTDIDRWSKRSAVPTEYGRSCAKVDKHTP